MHSLFLKYDIYMPLLLLLLPLAFAVLYFYWLRQSWQLHAQIKSNLSPLRLEAKLQQIRTWPNWWLDAPKQDTLFFFRGEAKGAGASMQWKQQHLVITQVQKQRLRYIHRLEGSLQLEGLLYWERTVQGSQLHWEIRPLSSSSGSLWQRWNYYFQLKRQLPQSLQTLVEYYNEA